MTRSNKTRRRSRKPPASDAGAAIASGGYGCVFQPALNCKSSSGQPSPDGVSKLMIKRHVKSEMDEVNRVAAYVRKIPNSQEYFLIDGISVCDNLAPLTQDDKRGFDSKCGNLTKRGITTGNVNNRLDKLSSINLPYGGPDMDKYWGDWLRLPGGVAKNRSFIATNSSLIKLLNNAIVPLNNNSYIHMDLKAGNILRSGDTTESTGIKTRIIDWGLSGSFAAKTRLPDAVIDRPLQYNAPMSIVLFDQDLTWLPAKLKEMKASTSFANRKLGAFELMIPISEMIFDEVISGSGHHGYMSIIVPSIFRFLYKANNGVKSNADSRLFRNVAVSYLASALAAFTDDDGNFDKVKYFHDVFSKNADVYGFIMTYLPLIEVTAYKGHNPWASGLTNAVGRIIAQYCFDPKYAATPIPISALTRDLKSLNDLLTGGKRLKTVAPTKKTKKVVKKKKQDIMDKPCPPGQKRHPATKRCRKVKSNKSNKRRKTRKSPPKGPSKASRGGILLQKGKKRCPAGYKKTRVNNDGRIKCDKK